MAPCVETIATVAKYRKAVDDATLFLEGKNDDLVASLRERMQAEAERENFEAAATLRDNIRLIEEQQVRQKMASVRGGEIDVFGYYREGQQAVLQVFSVRSGKVVDRDSFLVQELDAHDDAAFVQACVEQYYELGRFLPATVHLPIELHSRELVAEWLSGRKGSKVDILVPKRGGKRRLVELVNKNARLAFDLDFREEGRLARERLESLQEALELPERPERIEGFDISNIQGSEVVASTVVFERGRPQRSDYRKFKIRGLSTGKPDDFASMREVVLRRYRRVLEEDLALPDLILIDGGKGQLAAALESLEELGLSHLPIVSLAKKEEHIFRPGDDEPLILPSHSSARQLLEHVRDEAHRFAVAFHRQQRKSRDFRSTLESIPGVGPKKRRRLLMHFGSLKGVQGAALKELQGILGEKLGAQVHEHLREMRQ
jgi:excinuclease ABC subunit C